MRKTLFLSLTLPLLLASCAQQAGQYQAQPPKTTNKTAARMHEALPRYAALAKQPWPAIHLDRRYLRPGTSDQSIPSIRQRLAQLGDLPSTLENHSTLYDPQLTQAMKDFQFRHGLNPDGSIGAKTIDALNVTPSERFAQLEASMRKWASFPQDEGSRYILINTAGYEMNLIERGENVMDMRIVAGRPSRETPELFSKVETIVINPSWNVPNKILKKDIAPKVMEDPAYLEKEGIKIYSSWASNASVIDPTSIDWSQVSEEGFNYKMTQEPGDLNALGRVKFVFNNSHDVYMHDTPHKELFDNMQRAFSSGCIRLEQPFKLVEYFIQKDGGLNAEQIYSQLETGQTKYFRLKNPMPIYITYITAWVDEKNRPHFREDVYKREGMEQAY